MPRTPTRALGAAAATLAVLLVGACASSQPARLDTPLDADEQPLVTAAEATPDPTIEPPDDDHAAVGELADGFPTDLVPLPDDAEILVSSAEPGTDDGTTAISLNLRTSLAADELMASLRTALTDAGFTEGPVATPPAGVAAESTFARESGEVLTVAVLDRDGVRTLTLGGRVVVP